MANNNQTLDLGAMLESNLNDIPDAPDFLTPPAGEYMLEVKDAKIESYSTKAEPNVTKQRIRISYAVSSTLSVAGAEPPVPDGSLFSETFMGTTQGLSFFKKKVQDITQSSSVADVSLGDLLDSIKGASLKARITIKTSPNPNDPNRPYENLQIRVVA